MEDGAMPRYLIAPEKPRTPAPPAPARPPLTRLGLADVHWVIRTALDRQKLLVAFVGLCLAGALYAGIASVGAAVGSAVWGAIFRTLGGGAAYLALGFTLFVLSRMVQFEHHTGGVRTGAADAVRAGLRRLGAFCVLPGGLALLALLLVTFMGLLAWLGRVSPPFFSFLFLVEFALGLVLVAVVAVLTWGLFLYPALMMHQGADGLDTVRRLVRLYREHGLALAGYEVLGLVLAWLAALVPGVLAVLALAFVARVAGPAMGASLDRCIVRIPAALKSIADGWLAAVGWSIDWVFRLQNGLVRGLLAMLHPADVNRAKGFWFGLSGLFLGVSLLVIVAVSLAYALVVFAAAGNRVYLAYAPADPKPSAEQRAVA